MEIAHSFLRLLVQKRARNHDLVRTVANRLGIRVPVDTDDCELSARRAIAETGAALPPGAADHWADPLLWATAIDRAEPRCNSRLLREDVIAIPHELIQRGIATEAIRRYAQRLADEHATPVHHVLYDTATDHPCAHVMYAGRRLTPDGHAFKTTRDLDQNGPDLIHRHRASWVAVGVELGFDIRLGEDLEMLRRGT